MNWSCARRRWFIRRRRRKGEREIRGIDPAGQRGQFKTGQAEVRFAKENQFFRRTCRNFGDRFAQQGPHGLQPFVGGGIARNKLALLDEI